MRRAFGVLAVVSLLVLWSSAAEAQVGIWLQKGVSGFGFGAGINGGNHQVTGTFGGGYSYEGFLDFELDFGYVTPTQNVFGADDVHGFSVSPGIIYHVLKQDKEMPISVSVGAFYNRFFYTSKEFDDADFSVEQNAVSGTLALYRFFRIADKFGIIPAASFGFGHTWVSATQNGASQSNDTNGIAFTFGGYLAYIDDGGRIWGLVPSLTIGKSLGDNAGDATVSGGVSLNLIWSIQ